MGKFIDLTGQKFNRLTVIERANDKDYKRPHWVCKCECGTIKIVYGGHLKNGSIKSCGCYNSEVVKKRNEELWKNDNFRQRRSEDMKNLWQDEDFRKKGIERTKKLNEELWQDEDFRKMHSNRMKKMANEMWHDEDFKQMQSGRIGNKNPNYKGGITLIAKHLRNLNIIRQWRKDTYIRENSKCQLTGKHVHGGNSDVHHLYSFNMIVKEAHDLYNIQIKENVSEYTEEELKLLEEYVASCHIDTSNAVLLSEEVHSLFHTIYGCKNNTPEQYIEFKERYLAGEFKEILK